MVYNTTKKTRVLNATVVPLLDDRTSGSQPFLIASQNHVMLWFTQTCGHARPEIWRCTLNGLIFAIDTAGILGQISSDLEKKIDLQIQQAMFQGDCVIFLVDGRAIVRQTSR